MRSRRYDRKPETVVEKRFFDLRDKGYRGPVNQDGYAVTEAWIERRAEDARKRR